MTGVEKTPEAPALGFSITSNLDGNSQIVLQSFLPLDATKAEIDEVLDRVMGRVDRQRAKYQLLETEEDLAKHVKTLGQFHEDIETHKQAHERQQALRKVELDERGKHLPAARNQAEGEIDMKIVELQQRHKDEWDAGANEAVANGRRGAYQPSGYRKRNLDLITEALDTIKATKPKAMEEFETQYASGTAVAEAEIEKSEVQFAAEQSNLQTNVRRYEQAIVDLNAKIVRLKAAAEG